MPPKHEQIDPNRLCEAAEAVMLAIIEISEATHGGFVYPPTLMGTVGQPECLCDFTKYEVEEATMFLIRLGMVEVLR